MLYAPKLRSNLKVSRQHTNGGTFYILKNPASNEFFRLREAEGFIADQFDGRTTLDVIRERTESKFEVNLPIEILDAFVNNLERTGLLETGKPTPSVQARRIAGSLLYLRFKIFDPARLLNALIRPASFCFTPFFVFLSAAAILAAVVVLASNWEECAQELPRLYHASSIALFVFLSFFVVSTHELAHGMTCKHFGGEVHEIGFMLIYLQPALYCNVSDAWLFPEKWKRLSVGFAGPYFELFVWSIAVMAWRLTDGDTWIHDAALIVTTTSGIKTLLNFNPFIKLDGYYLLSDYLEIPNLRRKAFRYVGSFIQRFFGYSAPAGEELSARERTVFLLYGLVATVSSFLLLAYVIFRTGSLFFEKGQPVALVLSIGFIVLKLRRRFRRLFGKSSNTADPDDDGEALSTSGSGQNHSKSEPRKRTRRSAKKWIPFALALGAVLALIIFCSVGHMELRVAGAFMILPIENSDVRAVVEGMIDRIYVNEGDEVKAGQLVARLSDLDLRAALQSTEAEIRAAAAKLRMLEAGPTSYQVEVAKAVVAKEGDRLKFAQNRETRIKGLFDEHLRSRNEYEDAKAQASAAENDLNEASSRLNLLRSGNRPEEIEATRAEISRLHGHRQYLREQLSLLDVLSPASGIVATPSRQLKEKHNELVRKGDLILKIYDFKTVTAQILVSEKDIDGIHIGQRVVARARAFPYREFDGRVTSIATSAQSPAGSAEQTLTSAAVSGPNTTNKTILVTTELVNSDMLLKSEMTGVAKISCGQKRVIDLIKRRIARTFKVELWSWW